MSMSMSMSSSHPLPTFGNNCSEDHEDAQARRAARVPSRGRLRHGLRHPNVHGQEDDGDAHDRAHTDFAPVVSPCRSTSLAMRGVSATDGATSTVGMCCCVYVQNPRRGLSATSVYINRVFIPFQCTALPPRPIDPMRVVLFCRGDRPRLYCQVRS